VCIYIGRRRVEGGEYREEEKNKESIGRRRRTRSL
jgi:hypothetical protein